MNHDVIDAAHGTVTNGRKGIVYDWQSLSAAGGVEQIEIELAELVLQSAE